MKKLAWIAVIILVAILVITLSVGGFYFERWFNYKMSYSVQVEKQIKPLREDIEKLNRRIEKLEKKKGG